MLVVTGLVVVTAWLWLVSSPTPPHRRAIPELSDTVTVGWSDSELVSINAKEDPDALRALGYVHGVTRGWTIALWRRTALGRVSQWFGAKLVPIDRHVLRLGLKRHAKAAYEELPPPTQRRLRAYSQGLNSALQSEEVQSQHPFVLFDLTPRPWEPWHVVLIERLIAWIATGPLELPPDPGPALANFRETDGQLRRWLHLHGWSRGLIWALRPASSDAASSPTLFQRHVLGATAAPVVQEVRLQLEDDPPIKAATLPGGPFSPTAVTPQRAWGLLLSSTARAERINPQSRSRTWWTERISPRGADEQLVTVPRLGGALPIAPSLTDSNGARPDSMWVVQWPGFTSRSDASAWMDALRLDPDPADSTAFRLFDGTGLQLSKDGTWQVLGRPPAVESIDDLSGVMVGTSNWTSHQAESLESLLKTSTPGMHTLSRSDSSTWAGTLLSTFQNGLPQTSGASDPVRGALQYLRNWNHRYESMSIGATVFEFWMRAYQEEISARPDIPDTTYFAEYRRRQAFREAVDTLVSRYGPDVRRWRWERVAPDQRYFPVWSADSLSSVAESALATTWYAPVIRPGRGHPSTLVGGPSLVDPVVTAPSPTKWTGWMRPIDTAFTTRRPRFNPDQFLARPLQRPEGSPAVSFENGTFHRTTILVPQ